MPAALAKGFEFDALYAATTAGLVQVKAVTAEEQPLACVLFPTSAPDCSP